MNKLYLITGATGHVGTVLLSKLLARNNKIRILALPDQKQWFPSGIEVVYGDITKEKHSYRFSTVKGFDSVVLINGFVPLKNNRFLRSVLEKTPDHWNSDRLLLTMRLTKEITSSRLYLSYPPTTTFINPFDRWV